MLVSDLRYNDFASRIQALRSSTAKTLFEHHRASAIAMLDQSIALARQRYGDHSDLESTQETSAAPNWTVVKKSADAVGTEECICGIKANGHYLPVLKVAKNNPRGPLQQTHKPSDQVEEYSRHFRAWHARGRRLP